MIGRIAAVAFGVLIAAALVIVVRMIGHASYPPPTGIGGNDPDALLTMVAEAPVGALLFVILSYVFGAFGGDPRAILGTRSC